MTIAGATRPKERISKYWNWRSTSYELDQDKSFKTEEDWAGLIKDLVQPHTRPGAMALDVGTGPGQLAFYLAGTGFDTTGIDISPKMVDLARQTAERMGLAVNFQTEDAENLPFPDNTFDVVVSRNLMWTLPSPGAAVREWHRVLRPGGRIIISDGFWKNQTWASASRRPFKLIRGIVNTSDRISLKFFLGYAGLFKTLPLYEGVTQAQVQALLQRTGFSPVLDCDTKRYFRAHPYARPLGATGAAPRFFIVYGNK